MRSSTNNEPRPKPSQMSETTAAPKRAPHTLWVRAGNCSISNAPTDPAPQGESFLVEALPAINQVPQEVLPSITGFS